MEISDNTVLLTGATRGIGRALLAGFLQRDNCVVAVAHDRDRLADLRRDFPAVETVACDLTDRDAVGRLATGVLRDYPTLNTVVHNAGIQVNDYAARFGADGGQDWSAFERELEINLATPLRLTHALLPHLRARPNAAVVTVSSGLAFAPKQSAPVYCATKAAVHAFSKALRYQYGGAGVAVFEIIPPLVDTDMTAGRGRGKISPEALADEFFRAYARDRYEVNVGKTKLLRVLHRLAPRVAEGLLRDA